MKRRAIVQGLGGAALLLALRPARASSEELAAAIAVYTGGVSPKPGRVHIDIAPLVENGNAVPVTISVDSAMSETDRVEAIALFNQLNPQRDVARFQLGPAVGRAQVGTRIRLATSQQLVALARFNDGSFHAQTVDVVVTLAACVE